MRLVSTTASSTPCCKKQPREPVRLDGPGFARRRLCVGVAIAPVAAALALAGAPAVAQGVDITHLRLERTGDDLYLSAALRFALPPPVLEVLDKGIAVHFVAEAEIIQERWYWTDKRVAQAARHMRLAYQPLTRRWRLNVSPVPITGVIATISLNQNFDTLEAALEAVSRIGRLHLGPVRDIGDEPEHRVGFRFRLDTSQLPRPFQIGLMGQSDWNLSVERTLRLPVETVP